MSFIYLKIDIYELAAGFGTFLGILELEIWVELVFC